MSAPPKATGVPVRDRRELIEHIAGGAKPKADWRIGTEHEKFVFRRADLRPAPYDDGPGIRAMLEGLARDYGWEPVLEDGKPIALTKGQANVTLEPGGQFELSGAPLRSIHETCREVAEHLEQCKAVAEPLGLGMLGMGFQPLWKREDIPWMPKGRYRIMRDYMPKVGTLGLDMMLRTCTIQVNLDFGSEADMVRKFRVSLALQPVATALFSNSPFTEGKPNGHQSWRSRIWRDTDPDRTGMLRFVFGPDMSYERYVEHALDVPMYFVYRDGRYVDAAGLSFRDFMAGKLSVLPGELPTLGDWADHLTTLFPEVRMKRYLEMRGADGGSWSQLCALPALWVGLLYDDDALDAAWELAKDWSDEERERLRVETPIHGLATPFRGGTVQDLAKRVLEIAEAGLKARARSGWLGVDETSFLASLKRTAETGITPASDKLARFEKEWDGRVEPLFEACAF